MEQGRFVNANGKMTLYELCHCCAPSNHSRELCHNEYPAIMLTNITCMAAHQIPQLITLLQNCIDFSHLN